MDITTVDIDTLEAGPKLDALIAHKMFGHDMLTGHYDATGSLEHSWFDTLDGDRVLVRKYSTDIAAAFTILDAMWHPKVTRDSGVWWVAHTDLKKGLFESNAETLPLAICRAALKAT